VFRACRIVFAGLILLTAIAVLNGCGGGTSAVATTPTPAPPLPPPSVASYSVSAASPNPSSLTAGGSSTSVLTVTPVDGYSGNVTLSCPSMSSTLSCSFSPNPVPVTADVPITSMLTLTTSPSTPGGAHTITVASKDAANLAASNGTQSLTLTTAAVIQHVVVIFQENRTPDNLFQDPILIARGADIAGSGINSQGQVIPLTAVDLGTAGPNPANFDLGHTHGDFHSMYDSGKMDGADRVHCNPLANCPPNAQFKYVYPNDVQPYFALAEQYTFGDRMFQTNQGPSFPAHQFIISGTSAPDATSNLFVAENPHESPNGCNSYPTNTVRLIDPSGNYTSMFPCFEHPTLTDFLNNAGISWRYYAPNAVWLGTAPNAIRHMCQVQTINGIPTCTGPDWANVITPETQFLTDIANGELATVTWVMPEGHTSDHAIQNDGSGPSWVASVVNAVGNSQYWENTAIIITWDDWGGWYDHVAPTVVDDGVSWGSGYIYGFRVPLMVVSPYAKARYISHETHDFGSILKFIEETFNLPSLNYADARADDLSDCFVTTQSPLTFHSIAAPLGAQHFISDKSPHTDPDDD
jgi:phospholipase C